MAPVTNFPVQDPYEYLEGFGNYHRSEAIAGAIPVAVNSPQTPPFGLRTERISSSSFVAPREQSYHTFLYRVNSSLIHSDFKPLNITEGYGSPSPTSSEYVTPNSLFWGSVPVPKTANWVNGQQLLGKNGEPQKKSGMALWLFSVTQSMDSKQVYSSLDGDCLIIPQAGTLDIQTELGKLLVRQNEIVVIPRSVRYRVTLPENKPCRGYICELYEGHFRLPDLGVIGTTGLANVRDFQIPTAFIDGDLASRVRSNARPAEEEWTVVSRLFGKLWHCTQTHTPFDVAGWHGTSYPYKFDLGRFSTLGNVRFDHHDPSLFTALSARNHGAEPSTAIVDFAVIGPRWFAAEGTMQLPYFHRNTMQEFYGPIISNPDPKFPLNAETNKFVPFTAGLNGSMSTHGPGEEEFQAARVKDMSKPTKTDDLGVSVFLLETDKPLILSEWASKCAELNPFKKAGKL
ncbi:hypothetical protein N0V82_004766 [Gnomoniopsis sp. IMI 355080]|nr:hypothetical protein N0V82_004766 [Gnomoniopsis sp. IMI 355080]